MLGLQETEGREWGSTFIVRELSQGKILLGLVPANRLEVTQIAMPDLILTASRSEKARAKAALKEA